MMEVKERRPYCSLSKSRKDKEGPYAGEAPPTLCHHRGKFNVKICLFWCFFFCNDVILKMSKNLLSKENEMFHEMEEL